MRRIRFVFLAVSALLLVALSLLIERAFRGLEAETEQRQAAVAGRILDEMERELTALLRREEDRPFEHYRFFLVSEGEIGTLERSPLALLPAEDFVLGYFQLEPDGSLTSPLEPGNPVLAQQQGTWIESPEINSRLEQLRLAIGDAWPPAAQTVADRQVSPPEIEPAGVEKAQQQKKKGAFVVLESLNRGASSRDKRTSKVEATQAADVYNFEQADDQNALQQAAVTTGERSEREIGQEIERVTGLKANQAIDVRLEPMVGRALAEGRMMLYRTVVVRDQIYRQGLVLDRGALLDWLTREVLSEVAEQATLVPSAGVAPPGSGVFEHRFAEPFGAISATLALDSLPGGSSATPVIGLSLLALTLATAGLFALYRMVAVAVAFAEQRNQFVASVSHELKTPLTAIRMYVEMLRDGMVSSDAKRQRYYELMTGESERLSRLIDNVLRFSALERGEQPLEVMIGDPRPVLEEAVGILRPHAEQEGFELRLEIEPEPPSVRFDGDALKQVLFNLIDNAIKYSASARHKEIVLRTTKRADGLLVVVADRGPGVKRDQLKKVFQLFYRGDDELTRSSKGAGLGLALVDSLVERMGGTTKARNLEDGGFEVEIFLRV